MIVRTATADIEVLAPVKLLNQVFDSCDGTRTLTEVLALLPDAASRDEMAAFIEFLFQQGALIDGSLACAQTLRLGYQYSPFGLVAEPRITGQIAQRFQWSVGQDAEKLQGNTVRVPQAPLDALLSARFTHYTFDDVGLPTTQLHQLLWSLAGVVSTKHPRAGFSAPQRTLGSAGGMHLLTVYVALRRAVGRWSPGVYRVHYPQARTFALTKLPSDIDELPLAFGKPWHLTFATGAIFIAADPSIGATRYRNRSLQYLFMEAGAALHNGALTAAALGFGYATIGGYYEEPVAKLCGLDNELVLGSAIFGSPAKPNQVEKLSVAAPIDFAWVKGEAPRLKMNFHLARARYKTDTNDRPFSWGRDLSPRMALRKAVAEAIEREGYQQPKNIVEGTMDEVPGALDPRAFIRYTVSQYKRPGFRHVPFDPTMRHAWVPGICLVTKKQVHVAAGLVFTHGSLVANGYATENSLAQVTSSGCAAGISTDDATHRALLEAIERDAFMQHWFSQTPGIVVPPKQWPDQLTKRILALQEAGCAISIQRLTSRSVHVALVSAQHVERHFTTMGAAASHSFTEAVERAIDEAETRIYAWLHGHACTIVAPEQVLTVEHHIELYGLKRFFKKADRVLFPENAQQTSRWPSATKTRSLQDLVQRLGAEAKRPIVVDITPKLHRVDQGRTALSVVKALVPGFLPLTFGFQREALGMISRPHPNARFPHPFP